MTRCPIVAGVIALAASAAWMMVLVPAAADPIDPPFQSIWARTDQPVADGAISRTWIWGPEATGGILREPYTESQFGMRTVQYFDKSRMEVNNPGSDRSSPWFVTNGLLVVEMMNGQLQIGDRDFIAYRPAEINVAGDLDDPDGPTYRTFGMLRGLAAHRVGSSIDQAVNRAGDVVTLSPLAVPADISAAYLEPITNHSVASVFWDFMQSRGIVYQDGEITTDRLFVNPYYATGYPVTEPYWTRVRVAGRRRAVLVQAFERRILTYTPGNPRGWQVEAGNVGTHYYRWRYGAEGVRGLNLERAISSYEEMQRVFYIPEVRLYRETADEAAVPYSYLWPYTRAVGATVNLAEIPVNGGQYLDDIRLRFDGGQRYFNADHMPPGFESYVVPPLGQGGDLFYDDNAWMGLNLVRMYQVTHDADMLDRARQVFELLISGWDDDPSHPAPGGVFWVDAPWNRDRNVVSTGTGSILALRLYEFTGEGRYLDWALKMYEWVSARLQAPSGLFWDHIDLEGTVETTQWSYNQGTMIGANVLLARVTGNTLYHERAVAIADAAVAFFSADDRLVGQPPEFNAIFFDNLMLLYASYPDPSYLDMIGRYADRIWETRRDANSGMFTFSEPAQLREQAAMVEIFAVLAKSAQDLPRTSGLKNVTHTLSSTRTPSEDGIRSQTRVPGVRTESVTRRDTDDTT